MTRIRRPSAATLKILKCLSESPDGLHGYALMKGAGLASGTLYPILGRLAERAWLDKVWETGEDLSGPPRRIYKLTDLGRTQLKHYSADAAQPASNQILGAAQ